LSQFSSEDFDRLVPLIGEAGATVGVCRYNVLRANGLEFTDPNLRNQGLLVRVLPGALASKSCQ
jgi:hypothetical protein